MQKDEIEQLLVKVGLGDRLAFSQLFDTTSGKLLGICLRILGDRQAAEDAVQDSFIKVWRNANKYQVNQHGPLPWLNTIARNTAIDKLRSQKPTEDMTDYMEFMSSPGGDPEQAAIATSEAARILACLDELSADRRDAIKGAYLQGERYQDISERLNIPLNTVRTWLRRGLMSLRECMSR